MENKKEFYPDFIIIPYQLIIDKNLQPLDRNLYGIIYWYEHLKDGICKASNNTFAKKLNVDIGTIQNALTRLEQNNYIKRFFKDESKRVRSEIKTLISYNKVSLNNDMVSLFNDTQVSLNNEENNNIYIEKNNNKYKEVFSSLLLSYKEKIQKNVRLTDGARNKIKTRLKNYTLEELLLAIDKFSKDKWWMDRNGNRGMAWFFESDDRIEQFINFKEKKLGFTVIRPSLNVKNN